MASETGKIKIDVRAYPIKEPRNSTVAFASATINDMLGINSIRVVNGVNGLFAAMPQAKDSSGEYRDICFPVTAEFRKQLNKAVLDAYTAAVEKSTPDKAQEKPVKAKEKKAPERA